MQNAPSKRPATARVLDNDEDSLENILAQIKAQEDSEALARKLQDEWNAPVPCGRWQPTAGGSGSHNSSGPSDIIVISDDDAEDDQAMARRLAKEWDLEDSVLQSHPLASSRRPSPPKDKARHSSSDTSPAPLPTSDLAQYRELFVGERSCSCGFRMPTSRGLVSQCATAAPGNFLLSFLGHVHDTDATSKSFAFTACPLQILQQEPLSCLHVRNNVPTLVQGQAAK